MNENIRVLIEMICCVGIGSIIFKYLCMSNQSDVKVDFHTFLSMYNISPESYKFYGAYNPIAYDGVSGGCNIGIKLPGYIRYLFWLNTKDKTEKQQKEIAAALKLVEDWQRDIERIGNKDNE